MKKLTKFWGWFTAFLLIVAWPGLASAAGMVQCDPAKPLTQAGSCNLCALLETVQKMITSAIEWVFIVAVGLIVYNGILMYFSQGKPEKFSKALHNILNVIIGIVIVLAAWIVINTLINTFAGAQSPLKFWNTIECTGGQTSQCSSFGGCVPDTYTCQTDFGQLDCPVGQKCGVHCSSKPSPSPTQCTEGATRCPQISCGTGLGMQVDRCVHGQWQKAMCCLNGCQNGQCL